MAKTARVRRAEARLRALLDKWQGPLGLVDWVVVIEFHPDATTLPGGPPKRRDRKNGIDTHMEVVTRWYYRQIFIHANIEQCQWLTERRLERTLVHELMHGVVNEMHDWHLEGGAGHEERVVTHLACAFQWVWDAAYKAGREAAQAEQAAIDAAADTGLRASMNGAQDDEHGNQGDGPHDRTAPGKKC